MPSCPGIYTKYLLPTVNCWSFQSQFLHRFYFDWEWVTCAQSQTNININYIYIYIYLLGEEKKKNALVILPEEREKRCPLVEIAEGARELVAR